MSYLDLIRRNFTEHAEVIAAAHAHLASQLDQAGELLVQSYRNGGKTIFLGNGGSAADAQHLAAEFLGRYLKNRPPLPALALHANTSVLTAIANDYGYEQVFVRQLQALACREDTVIGLSTSGNSPNVVAALRWAQAQSCATIALTAGGGGALQDYAEVMLAVPATLTPRIQECHILLGHILCEIVESQIF